MGRIKKNCLFIKLILYFGVALLVAQIAYMQVEHHLEHRMGQCYYPKASTVLETNGIRVPFFLDTNVGDSMGRLVQPERYQRLKRLTYIVPVVIFGTAILLAAFLFYRNNLRKPLKQLKMGMDKIRQQDLEFELTYHRKDELGQLCEIFENMRQNLKKTFYDFWQSEDQQSNLYSCIAHDLRTPLTILKGNNEVMRFMIQNHSDESKVLETIDISEDAIKRMERYTQALKQMKALENWDKALERVEINEFADKLQAEGRQLTKEHQKNVRVKCSCKGAYIFDQTLIQLVLDRLMENAVRFAEHEIMIQIRQENEHLHFEVTDDGEGFSPMALKKGANLFFTTDHSREHSGIGLAAANSLLKNYESSLHFGNRKEGGAVVWFEISYEVDV